MSNEIISVNHSHVLTVSGCTILKREMPLNRVGGSSGYTLNSNFEVVRKPKYVKRWENIQRGTPTARERNYTINKKEVRRRILTYLNTKQCGGKMFFWTISFPEKLSDDLAHKALNIWLTRLRAEGRIKAYLWVSERQKNGTIHFHLAIHRYLNVRDANRYMRASLLTISKDKKSGLDADKIKKYNGVDIAKNRKTKRVVNFAKKSKRNALSKYLTKYVSKSKDSFKRLAWHCSREYSNLFISVRISYQEALEGGLYSNLTFKPVVDDYYFVYYGYLDEPPDFFMEFLKDINDIVLSVLDESL